LFGTGTTNAHKCHKSERTQEKQRVTHRFELFAEFYRFFHRCKDILRSGEVGGRISVFRGVDAPMMGKEKVPAAIAPEGFQA
jgi:hypothetical protein